MKPKKRKMSGILINGLFALIAFACLYPVLLVIGVSFTDESSLAEYGFKVIPRAWSMDAYRYVVSAGDTIFRAYGITIAVTVIGTVVSTLVVLLYAYPLSRKDFKFRQFFTFMAFFTMLLSGGIVPWYMVCTNVLHLKNTIWVLILPYVMNAWHVIVMRSFFTMSIPAAIIESAKIDGAGEWRILFQLVMPLAVPGIATIALFSTLTYWNDWTLPLYFVTEPQMYNLQFLLQSLIANIQMLMENSAMFGTSNLLANIPKEGARMALCIIATGPILIVYPFFQKYFIQGLTVGSVKG